MAKNWMPTNPKEWREAMREKNLEGHDIYSLKDELNINYKSGSKIGHEQFLLLRTLWIQNPPQKFVITNWISQTNVQEAKDMLKHFKEWNTYCDILKSGQKKQGRWHAKEAGRFTPVLKQQIEIDRIDINTLAEVQKVIMTPSPGIGQRRAHGLNQRAAATTRTPVSASSDDSEPPRSKDSFGDLSFQPSDTPDEDGLEGEDESRDTNQQAASDEQIVNMCQVLVLQGVIEHSNDSIDLPMSATIERQTFKFSDDLFKAVTDGCIKDMRTNTVKAILETKAMQRTRKRSSICRQEGAEMACWIISDPEGKGAKRRADASYQRLLIAQDRDELWIILAVYDVSYVEYLQSKKVQKDAMSFLVMHEYGPFKMDDSAAIDTFATFILAFSVEEGTRPPQYSTPIASKSGKAPRTYHDDSDDSINQDVERLTIGHTRDDDSDPFDSPSTHSTAQEARRHAQNTAPVSRVVSDDPPSPTPLASSSSVTGGRHRQGQAVQPTSKDPSNKPRDTKEPKRGDRTKTTESKDRKKDKVEPKDNKGGSSKDSKDRGRGTRPPKR